MRTPHSFVPRVFALCLLIPAFGATNALHAEDSTVLLEYNGGENPLAGSSTIWMNSGKTIFGEAVDQPEPAWRIWRGDSTGSLNFFFPEAEGILSEVRGKRWRLTARLRLDLSAQKNVESHGASMAVIFNEPGEEFAFSLCHSEEKQQSYVKVNRQIIPLPDVDVEKFHDYSIEFDPGTGQVFFLLDGEHVGTSAAAAAVTEQWRIFWGQRSTNSAAASEWASVKLEILE